ncbi:MAG: hypothetical protein JWO56_3403 [Acidobacteria bacterium]|nr:hypothetical protein [Acidobacteriota bacterium]
MTKTVEESEFAEHATALLDGVTTNGDEVLVTRHGQVVARVVPVEQRFGPMHGTVEILGDIEESIDAEWDAMK